MPVIYKYPLQVSPQQHIDIPNGARFLSIKTQRGDPVLWALVNPKESLRRYTIYTLPTGLEIESIRGNYVDTYLVSNDSLVWHVFID